MDNRKWEEPEIEDWEKRSNDERQALLALVLALGLGLGFGFACSPRRFCSPRKYCWPRQGCWPV